MLFPESIVNVINSFKKIPGVGEKSAERYALSLIDLTDEDINKFSNSLIEAKNKIRKCSICGHLTDQDVCCICNDENRKDNLICVVEDYKSVFMFEKSGTYKGKYHVLNGLISPIDGIYPEDINLNPLIDRIKDLEDAEIIIALKPSVEGETTTLYIKKIFENKNIKVSRLSYGIPMGVELDYLDSITLDRALLDRKEIS